MLQCLFIMQSKQSKALGQTCHIYKQLSGLSSFRGDCASSRINKKKNVWYFETKRTLINSTKSSSKFGWIEIYKLWSPQMKVISLILSTVSCRSDREPRVRCTWFTALDNYILRRAEHINKSIMNWTYICIYKVAQKSSSYPICKHKQDRMMIFGPPRIDELATFLRVHWRWPKPFEPIMRLIVSIKTEYKTDILSVEEYSRTV